MKPTLAEEFFASQTVTQTTFTGTGVITLAVGGKRKFSTRGEKKIRRNAIISNRTDEILDILDGTGNIAITMQGLTEISLETTDDFSVANNSVNPIDCVVCEFFENIDVVNAVAKLSKAP